MTNNCATCAHSKQYEVEPMVLKLHCLHEANQKSMFSPLCSEVNNNCQHYEYEAGTDGENE